MVNQTLKSIFTAPSTFTSNPQSPRKASRTMSTDLSNRKYMRWDTPGIEEVPPGEEDDINAVAEQMNKLQEQQFDNHRHVYTPTHSRTHGIIKGTFTVHDDLPPHLKQGELFANGASYPAACRYSTEPGAVGFDDRIPAPRGFAMKIFNVHGDFYEIGKDIPTQDIEFNSTPVIELATAKVTREIFDIRMGLGHLTETPEMKRELEKRPDAELQKARFHVKNTHLESMRQYSQSAYRFGSYVMKYSLVPNTTTQNNLYSEEVHPDQHSTDILHKWLQNFHKTHEAEYLFQVQLLENLGEQPVEYAGTPWDEEKYPWQTVATLRIPKQEAFDLQRKAFWEDCMRMDPWHGLKAYQPLGGSNRLRRVVYPASSKMRRRLNGAREVWVKSIDEIPN